MNGFLWLPFDFSIARSVESETSVRRRVVNWDTLADDAEIVYSLVPITTHAHASPIGHVK
jgi:hypothetical protein